jgi:hypothetical protein
MTLSLMAALTRLDGECSAVWKRLTESGILA